jgi:hypothetical protein
MPLYKPPNLSARTRILWIVRLYFRRRAREPGAAEMPSLPSESNASEGDRPTPAEAHRIRLRVPDALELGPTSMDRIDTIANFQQALDEVDPAFAEGVRQRQEAVASKSRRAKRGSSSRRRGRVRRARDRAADKTLG